MRIRTATTLVLVTLAVPATWLATSDQNYSVKRARPAPVPVAAVPPDSTRVLASNEEADTHLAATAVTTVPMPQGFPWSQASDTESPALPRPPTGADVPGETSKMSNAVAALAWQGGDGLVRVLSAYDALPQQAALAAINARVLRDFPAVGIAELELPASALAQLSLRSDIDLLALDEPVAGASWIKRHAVRRPGLLSPNNYSPADDVRVAVLDTGVSDHQDLNVTARADCTAGARGATRSIEDRFDVRAFDGSNGDHAWNGAWVEGGESDGVRNGSIEVNSYYGACLAGACLELEARQVGRSASRSFDIAGAGDATLSYMVGNAAGTGEVVVEISADGNAFETLESYRLEQANGVTGVSMDISRFASADTTVRARIVRSSSDASSGFGVLGIDNLRIDAVLPQEACVAAGASVQDAESGTLRDIFTSRVFSNNNGTLSFASGWIEVGESDGALRGFLEVDNDFGLCLSGDCLQVETGDANDAVVRKMNLAGAAGAELSFTYSHTLGGTIALEASSDGGAGWSTLETFVMDRVVHDRALSVDLLPYASEQTQLRFRVLAPGSLEGPGGNPNREGMLGIDNLEIHVTASDVDGYDQKGHGTHVAGIVAASPTTLFDHRGIAPGAGIVSVRVLDGEGRGYTSDVIAGLDWVLANADDEKIRVVNLSLGKAVLESASTDPLVRAVEAAWDAGLVVVASAGNYGRDGNFTITSPGNSPKVITVGSITDQNTPELGDDYVSTYSSRGPTLVDHYLKPDLLAPGNRVVASVGAYSQLYVDYLDRRNGSDYLELSGTSMAAAMASGAVVLMLSKDPQLNPGTVKARLMRSARKVQGTILETGAGVLDIEGAMDESGWISGQALSPRLARSNDGATALIENTAALWGHPAWSNAYLWSDGYLWSDAYLWSDGYLWSDAYLWSDGYLWSDAYLWSDGYLWSDAYLWSDGYLWSDAVRDLVPLNSAGAMGSSLADD
ncbi:MAG: S8 family serine peptidase [Pseudomonadota bacterium]